MPTAVPCREPIGSVGSGGRSSFGEAEQREPEYIERERISRLSSPRGLLAGIDEGPPLPRQSSTGTRLAAARGARREGELLSVAASRRARRIPGRRLGRGYSYCPSSSSSEGVLIELLVEPAPSESTAVDATPRRVQHVTLQYLCRCPARNVLSNDSLSR